ncbi:hypothetical protein Ahy_B06g083868 isoform B [Arachis hypogaea]|uniref:Uncharacterized protein n=1 Tax=Arachis hypogaea TaxID=3818 RepID=A0A444YQK1_ARAHY|nr:hypothetical protein Ahy_B06g083868 isoform B [Arachis hypogaea]
MNSGGEDWQSFIGCDQNLQGFEITWSFTSNQEDCALIKSSAHCIFMERNSLAWIVTLTSNLLKRKEKDLGMISTKLKS